MVPAFHPTRPQRVCDTCAEAQQVDEQEEQDGPGELAGRRTLTAERLAKPVAAAAGEAWCELGVVRVRVLEARGLLAADQNIVGQKSFSDPYCTLRMDGGEIVRTRTIASTLEPRWNTCVDFVIGRAEPVLSLELWDADTISADDPLGSVRLRLGDLQPDFPPHRGWVQLTPPDWAEDHTGAAGAVLLEVQLIELRPMQHLVAHLAPAPPAPEPDPRFDINAVYGPLMKIVDLVVFGLICPVVFFVMDLIFWTNPLHSVLALIVWNVTAGHYLEHVPAAWFAGLAMYVLSWRGHKQPSDAKSQMSNAPTEDLDPPEQPPVTSSRSQGPPRAASSKPPERAESKEGSASLPARSPSQEEQKEEHLGGFAQRLAVVLPASIKDKCRRKQNTLRTAADACQMVHDLFTWRHSGSPALAGVLSALAALCELLPYSTVLMGFGTLALLACSPVLTAAQGLVHYCRWRAIRHAGYQQPSEWGMEDDYRPEWSSKDYVASKKRRTAGCWHQARSTLTEMAMRVLIPGAEARPAPAVVSESSEHPGTDCRRRAGAAQRRAGPGGQPEPSCKLR